MEESWAGHHSDRSGIRSDRSGIEENRSGNCVDSQWNFRRQFPDIWLTAPHNGAVPEFIAVEVTTPKHPMGFLSRMADDANSLDFSTQTIPA